jgi:uncharacterized membrane protein SpoIIM required for sporulation
MLKYFSSGINYLKTAISFDSRMVLEQLYSISYLNSRKWMLSVISFAYSIIGIALAALLFHGVASVSLALICLMLLITLKDLIKISEKGRALQHIAGEYMGIMSILAYIFIGVIAAFLLMSLILTPQSREYILGESADLSAQDLFSPLQFGPVFLNNSVVLLVCLLSAFLFGIETLFFFIVVWNASVAGTTFGAAAAGSPIVVAIILLAALPHIVLEIGAFLLAGITGENFSKCVLDGRLYGHTVKYGLTLVAVSLLMLILASSFEVTWAPGVIQLFS